MRYGFLFMSLVACTSAIEPSDNGDQHIIDGKTYVPHPRAGDLTRHALLVADNPDVIYSHRATDPSSVRVKDVHLELSVTRGGGSIGADRLVSDPYGEARFDWTLGVIPMPNVIEVVSDTGWYAATYVVDVMKPGYHLPFVVRSKDLPELRDVTPDGDGFIGSTSTGLVRIDAKGNVTALTTSGEALIDPYGVAFDHDGVLWVAAPGQHAVMTVTDGVVARAVDADANGAFERPLEIAAGNLPGKYEDQQAYAMYVTDPCRGFVYMIEPYTHAVISTSKPLANAGDVGAGPKGLMFAVSGRACDGSLASAPEAMAFQGDLPIQLFNAPEPVGDPLGNDAPRALRGMAFDGENNRYSIFESDRASTLVVYTKGVDTVVTPRRVLETTAGGLVTVTSRGSELIVLVAGGAKVQSADGEVEGPVLLGLTTGLAPADVPPAMLPRGSELYYEP